MSPTIPFEINLITWNHSLKLTIEKLVYGGDGLARLPAGNPAGDDLLSEQAHGKAVFIPFTLPGETVNASIIEQKRGFARAAVDEIVDASQHRVEPSCPYFLRCGGCHYQHSDYEYQLEIKAAILRENLRRLAKVELNTELQIHPSPPWSYRNRTRLAVQSTPEFALCYRKFNSHQLLPVDQCPISSPLINRAIASVTKFGRQAAAPIGVREIELFANADDSALLIEVFCSDDISTPAIQQWTQGIQLQISEVIGVVAVKTGASNFMAGTHFEEKIASAGADNLQYKISQSSFRVSAGSFFQVNRYLIDELLEIVTHGCSGETALDLYAGAGLFSSVLNREFQRVIAVESSQSSYQDLLYNSPPNVKAVQSTVEKYLQNAVGKLRPGLIIVDPPRVGLNAEVLGSLASLGAPRLTYVSCDPATLARDMRGLLSSGYKIDQAHLIDLFPQTFHIESVFRLVQ